MIGDEVIGTVTSGGWGHRLQTNLVYAFVDPKYQAIGTACEIDVLGMRIAAIVSPTGPYRAQSSV